MIKVLIVGGGIGGLCSAVALRRVGADVHVVEVNAAWDVYGVGIIQPGNALRALAALGLAGPCLQQGFGFPGHQQFDRDGNAFAPPLDKAGNSVKAQLAIEYVARELSLNLFSPRSIGHIEN